MQSPVYMLESQDYVLYLFLESESSLCVLYLNVCMKYHSLLAPGFKTFSSRYLYVVDKSVIFLSLFDLYVLLIPFSGL